MIHVTAFARSHAGSISRAHCAASDDVALDVGDDPDLGSGLSSAPPVSFVERDEFRAAGFEVVQTRFRKLDVPAIWA